MAASLLRRLSSSFCLVHATPLDLPRLQHRPIHTCCCLRPASCVSSLAAHPLISHAGGSLPNQPQNTEYTPLNLWGYLVDRSLQSLCLVPSVPDLPLSLLPGKFPPPFPYKPVWKIEDVFTRHCVAHQSRTVTQNKRSIWLKGSRDRPPLTL